ncbi:serine hydrolase domain-containing protein [Catellatospora sp. KI3]|uniref:serine hydrolase domain-containing protein n=1 Tax=Catellatospora sp. KI3 TaxID=3041620 RepID=UPI002482EFDF|nr:serine hydrolase domain-containing protein [Catellatospora sp. KI3]MDI1463751.1 serine hydrolase domain-containing protein [Catellatospora sp. KI3]
MDRRRFLALTAGTGIGTSLAALAPAASAEAAGYPYFNRRIPDAAHTQIGAMQAQGITSFAFTPANGWVLVTQTGGYYAGGIPDECFTKLGQMIANGTKIHCVAFPPAGGNSWVITGDNDMFARNIPAECYTRLQEFYAAGQHVVHVGFPPAGGNSWVVVGSGGGFYARGVDDECYQMMRNLSQGGRKVTRVAFPYTGGWAVVAQDEFHTRGIDDECFQQMKTFAAGGWQVHNIAFSPVNNGWSLISRGQVPVLPADRIRQVENNVNGADIWTRMAAYKTPGVAIAAVVNNQIAWSTGYGWLESGSGAAAHPETVFQAASISKAVSTVGFLRLLQGSPTLTLNSDIRPLLGWQLGQRACVSAGSGPSIDQLLAHRGGVIGRGSTSPANVCSGFTANSGGGFAGYGPNATVPTLLQVLNGQGNSPKVELSTEPGATYYYSGMGFELLHRMLEQQSGQTLATYMQNNVFSTLGMTSSSFSLTPAFELAAGHTTTGAVIPGKRNRYPESSAAGLYTNVIDLCRLVRWINQAWTAPGDITGPLTKSWVTTMLSQGATPGMGRGFFTANPGTNNFLYSHNGDNYGFKANFVGYPNLGAGFAVMANGDNMGLVTEVSNAVKAAYGWS